MGEDEISECSLWGDGFEVFGIFWIHLQPQVHCRNEMDIKLIDNLLEIDLNLNACTRHTKFNKRIY